MSRSSRSTGESAAYGRFYFAFMLGGNTSRPQPTQPDQPPSPTGLDHFRADRAKTARLHFGRRPDVNPARMVILAARTERASATRTQAEMAAGRSGDGAG